MIWFVPFLAVTALFTIIFMMTTIDGYTKDRGFLKMLFLFYVLVMVLVYCVFTGIQILNNLHG